MTAHDNESDLERKAGYAFSQVAGAVVGGIILCTLISAILTIFVGGEMTLGGAVLVTLFCIPLAWGIRALALRVFHR
ncbi:MAG TPA: hypothetical protein VLC29_10705 [Rhizomicrobium sp.]|nr:hypothetical protein [Rhizomicrobium sp.]